MIAYAVIAFSMVGIVLFLIWQERRDKKDEQKPQK